MAESDLTPFKGFRGRTILVGVATSVASFVLLYFVLRVGGGTTTCRPQGAVGELSCSTKVQASDAFIVAAASVLTTLLGIGVVSLLFEFLLRRQFGTDMLRFLKLDGAVVRSGLATLGSTNDTKLSDDLRDLNEVTVVARVPAGWLNEYVPALLREAHRRRLNITLALPNPDDPAVVAGCAKSIGLQPDDLANAVRAFKQSMESQWRTSLPTISLGTTLRIVWLDQVPTYDVVAANCMTAVLLAKPLGHTDSDELAVVVFRDQQHDFPSGWIVASLEPLKSANEAFMGEKK